MKRLLAWILALCTIFSLAACGGKGGKEEPEEVIDMTVLNARDLKVNNLTDPLGIDTEPTFCWTNKTNTVGRVQTAYQIIVASTKELAEAHTGDIWDTGKVASDENFDIPYEGKNYHLDVGHIGAELILPLLSQEGHGDIAMKILLQTDYPSWGYWVKQGSTTCWEGWSESVVRSYCHFFLGSYDEVVLSEPCRHS